MAKVIVAWCDPCMNTEVQTPGSSFTIALDNGKPLEVDLCETHEKEFLTPLRELLGEAGQPVHVDPPKVTTPGGGGPKLPCPTCQKSLTREGMRKHMMRQHELTRLQAGDVCRDVFGNVPNAPVGEYICEVCKDAGMLPAEYTFDIPQGLGAHKRNNHPKDGIRR